MQEFSEIDLHMSPWRQQSLKGGNKSKEWQPQPLPTEPPLCLIYNLATQFFVALAPSLAQPHHVTLSIFHHLHDLKLSLSFHNCWRLGDHIPWRKASQSLFASIQETQVGTQLFSSCDFRSCSDPSLRDFDRLRAKTQRIDRNLEEDFRHVNSINLTYRVKCLTLF